MGTSANVTRVVRGNVQALMVISMAVDLAQTNANTTAETTITVHGVKVGDLVFFNKPSYEAGMAICDARVSAADTIIITTMNTTGSNIDETSETMTFLVVRPSVVGDSAV